jgi:hypothetical protein
MALLLGLAACGSDGDGAAGPGSSAGRPSDPRPALALDFDPGPGAWDVVVEVVNDGSTAVSVAVAASGAVTLESIPGPDGSGAVRLPAFTAADEAPAVVLVATAAVAAALDPVTGTSGSAHRSGWTRSPPAARPTAATTCCSAVPSPAWASSRSSSTTGSRPAGSSGPTGRPSWRWRRQSTRMSGTRSPVGATAARCGSP